MNPIYRFELYKPNANLLDPEKMLKGYYLNVATGAISVQPAYAVSDYFKVEAGESYWLLDKNDNLIQMPYFVFYGKEKNYIYGGQGTNGYIAPVGSYYMRIAVPVQWDFADYAVVSSSSITYSRFVSLRAYPNYSADLNKVYEKESGEEFFRAKLSSSLTFQKGDYDFIMAQAFDFRFEVTIFISYDGGTSWSEYWKGEFWKTDCTINEDDENIEVTPSVVDEYTAVLDGMEKEYDLIKLAPEIEEINLDKRGMIQIYTPGESVVGCFLAGMWWEEQCAPETDDTLLTQTGDGKPNFKELMRVRFAKITNRSDISDGFFAKFVSINQSYQCKADGYIFKYTCQVATPWTQIWEIIRESDNVTLWRLQTYPQIPQDDSPITLAPVAGTSATGNVEIEFVDAQILARYICDVEKINLDDTYELPTDDFVFNNRNYHRVIQYTNANSIAISDRLTTTPTKWGIYQPGKYYLEPTTGYDEYFPIARTYWSRYSLWFDFPQINHAYEVASRKEIKLRNAYPLYSAIKVLLGQIAPSLVHENTSAYSRFLYATNPLSNDRLYWFITPKSNILVGEYDQPAQKAPVTLRQIFDMLRDCFRCYWFLDGDKLRIEHVSYFMRGGDYPPATPSVGRDLTTEKVTRNGKEWSFCTSKYSFDKSEMPARYEFGWMDDATTYFEGEPIEIISNYVDKGNIQKISVQDFSSDVDYLMLSPNNASQDGFALLGAMTPEHTNIVASPQSNKALLATGAVATLQGFSVSEYIAVDGRNIRSSGTPALPSPLYVDYCVYDENQTCIRFGRGDTYYYEPGDAYVRFTLDGTSPLAYYFYYYLPYLNYQVGINDHWLQNGYAAFVYLEAFYLYDLPASNYSIGGITGTALGTKKNKRQTLSFPCLYDPNLVNLIKTNMGDGKIGKISINLSSRNANVELMYDTE